MHGTCVADGTQNIHVVTTEIKAFVPFSTKGCIPVYHCQMSLVRR